MSLRSAVATQSLSRLREALARGDPNALAPLETPVLNEAIQRRWSAGVRLLLLGGADPSLADAYGLNAYHVAVLNDLASLRWLLDEDSLRRDALNAQANEMTPLDIAASRDDHAAITALLRAGAARRPQRVSAADHRMLRDAASNTRTWSTIQMLT